MGSMMGAVVMIVTVAEPMANLNTEAIRSGIIWKESERKRMNSITWLSFKTLENTPPPAIIRTIIEMAPIDLAELFITFPIAQAKCKNGNSNCPEKCDVGIAHNFGLENKL